VGVAEFRGPNATESVTTSGEKSRLASVTVPTPRGLLSGPENQVKIALPAYEGFSSDGTDGNTETFNLSNDLIQCPNTEDIVVYIGGTRTQPDAVDYANDTVDVTDPGSNNNIHVFYMVSDVGSVQLRKVAPTGESNADQELDSAALHHINQQDQTDNPHYLTFESDAEPWVPTDFALEINVTAQYQIALTDPDGDGAVADNALFEIPAVKARQEVPGLASAVRAQM
jgi:hypothetical protein